MLSVLIALTGIQAPAVRAEGTEEAVSNAHYLDINKTNFPDANFRSWITSNLAVSGSSSSGYYMTKAQAESVTSMNLKDVGISNAKGVEKFTNLQSLTLWNNSLTALDVTKNTKLTYLDLDNNQIKKLDLSKNTKLETLYVSNNCLGYLRLVNNTSLTSGVGSQYIYSQVGAKTSTKYLFDLTKLVPKSLLKYVSLNDSSHSLNTSTGVLTLGYEASNFTYYFDTGNSSVGSLYVTVYIDSYTSISKPKISTQPTSVTATVGETVSFTVKATGGQLKYQWQYRKSSSDSWTSVSADSGKTKTYTLTAAERHNGYQYRCVIKNLAGSATTETVKLTVSNKPKITTQPSDINAPIGDTVTFAVKALGPSLKYQWQYRKSSSDSWTNVSAASGKTAKFSLTTAARHNGYQYRCRVKNSYGTVYSKVVTLSVGKPIIKVQPTGVTATKDSTAEFAVTVRGGGLKFQWYYRTSSSGSWKKVTVSNATSYMMYSSVLQVKATKSVHGYQYRCVITNKYGKATSKTVTLLVKNGPVISTQPSDKTVYDGDTVKFTVKATGSSLKYQWQYRKSSSDSWTNVSAASGKKATYSMTAATRHNGYQYRCVISNSYGKVISKVVTLKVSAVTVHYRALLIGEEDFSPICTRNRGDVEHMKTMLGTVKGPKGTKYTVTTKFDLGYSAVESAIKSAFKSTTSQDVSLFFIATHGNSDGDGELALTDGSFLDFATLAGWLNSYVKGKVIVIIESCGSGSAIYQNKAEATAAMNAAKEADDLLVKKAVEAFAKVDEAEMANTGVGAMRQSKFYVLAASAHHQMSWGHESGDAGNYFTDWLVEGIGSSGSMPADTNSDGYVTLKELYTYIAQYDSYTFYDGYDYYTQQVQYYPENSTYKLFKR